LFHLLLLGQFARHGAYLPTTHSKTMQKRSHLTFLAANARLLLDHMLSFLDAGWRVFLKILSE